VSGGEEIHPLFQAALGEQHENFVYRQVIHLGGPRPLVGPRAQAGIAVRCAELVVPLVDGGTPRRQAKQQLETLARGLGERDYVPPPAPGREVRRDDVLTPESVVDVAHAAVVHAVARSRNTWRTARAAVARTARLLLVRHVAPHPSQLLAQLDDWIVRGELETIAGRRWAALLARVAGVLYRGGEMPARPSVWLVRLSDGRVALLAKLGGRLAVSEGEEGDVLATVPDAHFAACAAAVRRRA